MSRIMGLDFDADPAVKSTWNELRDDKGEINWILLGYGEAKDTVALVGKGSGGLAEFKQQLENAPDQVLYGVFKCYGIDEDSRRTKFVFVTWVGPSVTALKRARVSTHKTAFEVFFKGVHISVHPSEVSDLSEAELIAKLNSSTGAHKPKTYQF